MSQGGGSFVWPFGVGSGIGSREGCSLMREASSCFHAGGETWQAGILGLARLHEGIRSRKISAAFLASLRLIDCKLRYFGRR